MSRKIKNSVLRRVEEMAQKFGLAASTICGRAFKDSRKYERLQRRDSQECDDLERLGELAGELAQERLQRQAAGYSVDYRSGAVTELDSQGVPMTTSKRSAQ